MDFFNEKIINSPSLNEQYDFLLKEITDNFNNQTITNRQIDNNFTLLNQKITTAIKKTNELRSETLMQILTMKQEIDAHK